jgi:hypothetical protein
MQENQNEQQFDYEEIDFKICGELGNLFLMWLIIIEEKNRALDDFVNNQPPEGVIQVRI